MFHFFYFPLWCYICVCVFFFGGGVVSVLQFSCAAVFNPEFIAAVVTLNNINNDNSKSAFCLILLLFLSMSYLC